MSQTLKIDNFSSLNLKETTTLNADAAVSASTVSLLVENSQDFNANDIFIIGRLASETAEKRTVSSVPDITHINVAALTQPHSRFDAITKLFGDQIKVYRASNVDGNIPADSNFSALGSPINIDTDQASSSFTDSGGGNAYWYKYTYLNSLTTAETDLADSTAVRGGTGGNYCSIDSIRREAGLDNNRWMTDSKVDEKRQAAQAFINSVLTGSYVIPFSAPINPLIAEITRKLAAGYLLTNDYGPTQTLDTRQGQQKIDYVTNKDKTGILDRLQDHRMKLTGLLGEDDSITGSGVFDMFPSNTVTSTDPLLNDEPAPRMFSTKDRY